MAVFICFLFSWATPVLAKIFINNILQKVTAHVVVKAALFTYDCEIAEEKLNQGK